MELGTKGLKPARTVVVAMKRPARKRPGRPSSRALRFSPTRSKSGG